MESPRILQEFQVVSKLAAARSSKVGGFFQGEGVNAIPRAADDSLERYMTIADTATEISGVPTAKVFGTIAKLRKNTDLAAFGLSARNTCHGGRGHGCPSAVNVEFDVDADASPPAIDAQTTDNRLGPSSPMQWRSERPSSPFAGPVSLPWHLRWATDLLDRQHRRAANQELIVAAVWQQVRQIRGSTLGSRDGVVDLAPVERRVAPRRSDTRQGGG